MLNSIVKLHFLAGRKYLHSTSLFQYLIETLEADKDTTYKFISPIYSDCFYLTEQVENVNVLFQYTKDGEQKQIGVKEAPKSSDIIRLPFDENEIIANAHFMQDNVVFAANKDDFFCKSVCLIKQLHQLNHKDEKGGRWIFSRADLNFLPQNGEIEIHCTHKLPKVSCSQLIQNKVNFGKIYFSWVENL